MLCLSNVVVFETMVLVSSGLEAKFAGLGLEPSGLGLGLGLESCGLGLGLEAFGLGLGLGLESCGLGLERFGLDNNTGVYPV